MSDATDQLRGSGRDPSHPIDPARIFTRARRRAHRVVALGVGGTSALVIALLVVLLPTPPPTAPVISDQPGDCPTVLELVAAQGSETFDLPLDNDGLAGWVLPFLRGGTWTAGEESKFALSVDGTGFPTIDLTGPDGTPLADGVVPNSISSSSWTRPGAEFHITPTVPTPGCWELRITRDQGSASITLMVEPAPGEAMSTPRLVDFVVIGLQATNSPEIGELTRVGEEGRVVLDQDVLDATWPQLDPTGGAPTLSDGRGVLLLAVPSSTCGAVEDILAVEVAGSTATVILDEDGQIEQPCPGPSDSFRNRALAIAIDLDVAAAITEIDTRYVPAVSIASPTNTLAAPLSGRYGHTVTWTGSEVVVWGGEPTYSNSGPAFDDGARFDPTTDTWTPMAAAMGADLSDHLAVWTGNEVVMLGGRIDQRQTLAYDPATDTWRRAERSPADITSVTADAVWDGSQVLILTTGGELLAFDPTADTWTVEEPPPLASTDALALHTTDEGRLVAVGSLLDASGTARLQAAVREPDGSWRPGPKLDRLVAENADITGFLATLRADLTVLTGSGLLHIGRDGPPVPTLRWDLVGDEWERLSPSVMPGCEDRPRPIRVDDGAVANNGCGNGARYDEDGNAIPFDLAGDGGAGRVVWTGTELIGVVPSPGPGAAAGPLSTWRQSVESLADDMRPPNDDGKILIQTTLADPRLQAFLRTAGTTGFSGIVDSTDAGVVVQTTLDAPQPTASWPLDTCSIEHSDTITAVRWIVNPDTFQIIATSPVWGATSCLSN